MSRRDEYKQAVIGHLSDLPADRTIRVHSSPPSEVDQDYSSLSFSHYFWIIRRHLGKLVTFVAVAMFATFIASSRMQPVYESTATIDLDRQSPSGIVGQEANRIVAANDSDQFLATQIKLIQSDSVLRPVAQRFNLFKSSSDHLLSADELRLQAAAPVTLPQLSVSRAPNTYLLLIRYRSPDPQVAADVANAIATSYLGHTYRLRIESSQNLASFMEKQLDELKAKMERSGQALAVFERELNVISPEEKTSILSARLLQLNNEYTNAQADRVRKEAIYNATKTGSLEAVQISSQGAALTQITDDLNKAKRHFAEVKSVLGANHPDYRKAQNSIQELQKQLEDTRRDIVERLGIDYKQSLNREQLLAGAVTQTKSEYDRLNARSFEYQQLKREAEADKNLYEELVRKIKEAGINSGFQNNNVRIADRARPAQAPVYPNKKLNLLLAFTLSMMVGVGAIIAVDLLDTTIRDPEHLSHSFDTEVIGLLPSVRERNALLIGSGGGSIVHLEQAQHPDGKSYGAQTSYHEAIRTLRSSIILSSFGSAIRSLLITSAGPGEGKTTTACHLAMAHAMQGRKTLLVDADLRRPSVHRNFELENHLGTAELVLGTAHWRDVIQRASTEFPLDAICAGHASRRELDLVGSCLSGLIEEAGHIYDLVVIDAPPLLGFSETLQVAAFADGVVVVARAGQTKRAAVGHAIGLLRRLRANIVGLALNDLQLTRNGYYYYGHYRYNYRNNFQS
jgi:succinoglycan biosynthesis transport protein ExoP